MNCNQVIRAIDSIAAKAWTAQLRQNIDAHASECAACRARLRDAENLDSALQSLPETAAPDGFSAAVIAAVERCAEVQAQPVRTRGHGSDAPRLAWPLAGLGGGLALAAGVFDSLTSGGLQDVLGVREFGWPSVLSDLAMAGPAIWIVMAGVTVYLAGIFAVADFGRRI